MAGDKPASSARTPAKANKPAAGLSSSVKQRSIASFFQKSSPGGPASSPAARDKVSNPQPSSCLKETTKANSLPKAKPSTKLSTPVPSSDVIEPPSSQENLDSEATPTKDSLPTPTMITTVRQRKIPTATTPAVGSSPSRKVLYALNFSQ